MPTVKQIENSFLLKWEAEDIVSKIRVSLEVNTKYFLI